MKFASCLAQRRWWLTNGIFGRGSPTSRRIKSARSTFPTTTGQKNRKPKYVRKYPGTSLGSAHQSSPAMKARLLPYGGSRCTYLHGTIVFLPSLTCCEQPSYLWTFHKCLWTDIQEQWIDILALGPFRQMPDW